MNVLAIRTTSVSGILLAWCLYIVSFNSLALQSLSLGPLPWVGQVSEYLTNGTGQGFAGLATFYMGQPVIFYDDVWVQRMGGVGSPGFRFLRAHEYAHHARGHALVKLNSPPQMWPVLGYQEELDADCVAVKYLRHINDMAAVQAGFQLYQSVLPPQDTGGRPGAVVRINNMNQC
ncbi:hypothetical protein [Aeromonas sp. sif2416]|uniref:hypothetical protein n=1 Tax=Aeromonas sp. sif2416 TaxID=2854793 RepID=UPI001C46D2A5|nr:hypothetical protein [Aeromonas sp. sif2416]MBV7439682.1 hypothetical protein [Aeromonas sp. sif2416]